MAKDSKEKRLIDLLMHLCHDIFLNHFQQLSDMGLHPGQAAMLKLLYAKEGMSQSEIAKCLHVKPPTVAVSIKRLEKAGLLTRSQDAQDQRRSCVCLSEKGVELTENIMNIMKEGDNALLNGFTEAEICLFRRFLLQMAENAAKVSPKGGLPRQYNETERNETTCLKC